MNTLVWILGAVSVAAAGFVLSSQGGSPEPEYIPPTMPAPAAPQGAPQGAVFTAPQPQAPKPPVPRYVKFLEQRKLNDWKAFDYQFIPYDQDFVLDCAQAIMDTCGAVGNATRTPTQGAAEQELTKELTACGRIRACRPFLENNAAIAIGVGYQGMLLKTFLYPQTNRVTIMASGKAEEADVTRFLNEMIHKAISK